MGNDELADGATGLLSGEGLRPQTEASFASDPAASLDFRLMADLLPTLCWMANADGYIFW